MNINQLIMKCPCINCVCIAICRLKPYIEMKYKCELVYKYITTEQKKLVNMIDGYPYRIKLYEVLNPTEWGVNLKGELLSKKGKVSGESKISM